jgi:AraC-like DNA-binding protein
VFNFYEKIKENPHNYRQFRCRENLIALYNCPIESKMVDTWSQLNYIVYVMEGRKTWHTAHASYELNQGSCFFIRKGACIIEQFFDATFCLVIFFVPDEFICDVLKSKTSPIYKPGKKYDLVIPIDSDATVQTFFHSMLPHFETRQEPDQSLLELKFKELILNLAGNFFNSELLSYFCSLLLEPHIVSLQRTMESNYCFNLKLEQFAQLSNRSLSAFKRDFQKFYRTTPGKWLSEKRLKHARNLLVNAGRSVTEAAFESGFENPSHFSRIFRQHYGTTPGSVKNLL